MKTFINDWNQIKLMVVTCDKCDKILDDDAHGGVVHNTVLCGRHWKQLRRLIKCFTSDDGEVVMRAKEQSNLS